MKEYDIPDPSTENIEDIEPKCMYCGSVCRKTETIHTGDENSLRGWELWSWCDKCKQDTFHKIKLKQ